jgi:hypothetical protein
MKINLKSLPLAAVLIADVALAAPGGVFITGHDPDFHARVGANTMGAQHIIQRAVSYVTSGKLHPSILLVTDLRSPGGDDESDPRLGLTDAGLTFDVADYGSGAVLDLHTVDFADYDAVVIASDEGGWLRQDELDVLIQRSADITSYIDNGGGLVAFNESGNRPAGPGVYEGTTSGRFGFLSFVVSAAGAPQSEMDFRITPAGTALGITLGDVNGNYSHSYFTSTAGMDIIDTDSSGRVVSLASRSRALPLVPWFLCYGTQGLGIRVCSPVDSDVSTFLVGYPAQGHRLSKPQRISTQVTNSFGSFIVTDLKHNWRLMPSAVQTGSAPPALTTSDVPSFDCTAVTSVKGAAIPDVNVVDSFGSATLAIKSPTRLCRSVVRAQGSLLCYRVTSKRRPVPVFLTNERGSRKLVITAPQELCVS